MEVRPVLAQVEQRAEEVRTAGTPWPDVHRLVIVRHDRLGDFVLTLPTIEALRRTYPDAELALMVSPRVGPLAELVGGVDHVMEVDADAGGVRARLREFGTDLVVCVSRGAAFAWAAARSGAQHRVGTGFRYYSPLFERRVDEHRSAGARHEVEYALSYAHRAGAAPGPARFPLGEDPEAAAGIERWIARQGIRGPFVALHPGTGGSCPPWPLPHFLSLVGGLLDEQIDVVLTIGPADDEVEHELDAAPSRVRAVPRHRGTLPALAALLGRAAVVVGSSTGPVHLAAARGVPTLAFHAPWPTCGVSRWGPYSEGGWALVADAEGASSWSHGARRERAEELMRGVSPAVALGVVIDLLGGRRPRLETA